MDKNRMKKKKVSSGSGFLFDKVVIVGMGFMGGCLGKTLLEKRIARSVAGVGRNAGRLKTALKMGAASEISADIKNARMSDADIVVISVPVKKIPVIFRMIKNKLGKDTIVTDMGSVKGYVIKEIKKDDNKGCFIGSHPMVGSEKSGIAYSHSGLFEKGVCIVTPENKNDLKKTRKVTAMWRAAGMKTVNLSPAAHDAGVSKISHLPHFLAFALVNFAVPAVKDNCDIIGSGFRDATRIASSDEFVWSEIFETNRKRLLKDIDSFAREMRMFRKEIEKGDFEKVEKYIKKAAGIRGKIKE
ncbi:MAG TPA: prephenate dehydrogenase [Firmicutes bacterium]|nr:prephenate dehydrogenase [Bacillota bacterium]